jgi:hypothetical protein
MEEIKRSRGHDDLLSFSDFLKLKPGLLERKFAHCGVKYSPDLKEVIVEGAGKRTALNVEKKTVDGTEAKAQ